MLDREDRRAGELDPSEGGRRTNGSVDAPVIVIEPSTGWRLVDLKELWAYRELFWVLASRDVRVRYKQTMLGSAWAILQPVMMMIVFTIFFGKLAGVPSDGLPYPIFVFAGLLPWNFFASTISASGSSVVGSASLISKVYFPRLIIPLSSVGSNLVDLAVTCGVLLCMMLFYGVGFGWNLLLAPLMIFGLVLVALGVGTILCALMVEFRDFRFIMPFLVQFWMFATPVIYPASLVPEQWRWVLFLNPVTGFVEGFRSAFLGRPFDWPTLALSFAVSVAVFIAAVLYFEKVERRFSDVI